MIAIVDADIICYRIAFACADETEDVAKHRLDSYIVDILMCGVDKIPDCFVDCWSLHLTGSTNFRKDVAVTAVYKGNRADTPKPAHLAALRHHLISSWGAVVSDNEEADDAVAIEATTHGEDSVIVSLDKDLDQVRGWHYNFVKQVPYYVTAEEATFNFYSQLLTGDATDNIIGLRGIGPVKAKKLLLDSVDEYDMYQRCVAAYEGNEARVLENAHLLFLRRYKGQTWTPPQKSKQTT